MLRATCTGLLAELHAAPMELVSAPSQLPGLGVSALASVWASSLEAHGAPLGELPAAGPALASDCVAAFAQLLALRGEFAVLGHLAAALLPGHLAHRQLWFYGSRRAGDGCRWGVVAPA